ncbi:MAG: hypothetical protein BZ137_09265 [Methanosphaera sp. rholeuAM130]|nr:MAG: hypothetical protein BZ137_09265 [Methanosphaera sp. rholeuAM130]
MNNKIVIPIIIILLLGIGLFGYLTYFADDGSAVISNSKISIPSTFKIVKSKEKETVISDGKLNITLTVCDNKSVKELVDEYLKSKETKNQTVESEDITLSGVNVVKTTLVDTETNITFVNYWFEKDGKQYRFHSDIPNAQDDQLKSFEGTVATLINGTSKT